MICPKHGVDMPVVLPLHPQAAAPLHRCPLCTADFNAAFAKATRVKARRPYNLIQRALPPVVMSERWP